MKGITLEEKHTLLEEKVTCQNRFSDVTFAKYQATIIVKTVV